MSAAAAEQKSRESSATSPHSSQSSKGEGYEEASNNDPEKQAQGSTDSPEHDKQFEVAFDGDDDPDNPRNMSLFRRWLIVCALSSCSLCVTNNSSIYIFTNDQVTVEFGVSDEVAILGLSLFVLGLAVGPICLAPMSEFFGRRLIYIVAFTFTFIFIIPCAVAQNIQTLLISRFLDGVAASCFLNVAGGTVGDLFPRESLSFPMMIYTAAPFLGPTSGPIIGGFINQYTDWRWTFWMLLIWTGVEFVILYLLVPETYHPVLLRRKAQRLRKETGNSAWYAPIELTNQSIPKYVLFSCGRPFKLLFHEPMVLNLCLLSAMILGVLYLFFGAFTLIFENNHGFDLSQVGLSFLGIFVGMILAVFMDPIWQWNYRRLLRNREKRTGEMGVTEPEFRLPPTIFGAQMIWIGLFGFAWTTFASVHWIVPIFFSGFVGFGAVPAYFGIFTFLVESYPLYAASALGANSIVRCIFASSFPLFGPYMYNGLGYQWASSVLAFLCLGLAPFPYIFYRYGKKIRSRSRFASKK